VARIRKYMERKTNPRISALIERLLEESAKRDSGLWKDLAYRLARPRKFMAEVNVSKINRYAGDSTIVVPGKVLSSGNIEKKVTVAALGFSEKAKEKIEKSGGRAITIEELIDSNPDGSNVTIME